MPCALSRRGRQGSGAHVLDPRAQVFGVSVGVARIGSLSGTPRHVQVPARPVAVVPELTMSRSLSAGLTGGAARSRSRTESWTSRSISRRRLATRLIAVADLLPRHEALTAEEAVRRMRCTRWGARAVQEWRIIYVGGSVLGTDHHRCLRPHEGRGIRLSPAFAAAGDSSGCPANRTWSPAVPAARKPWSLPLSTAEQEPANGRRKTMPLDAMRCVTVGVG